MLTKTGRCLILFSRPQDAAHILHNFGFIANLQIATVQVAYRHLENSVMWLGGVLGETESS